MFENYLVYVFIVMYRMLCYMELYHLSAFTIFCLYIVDVNYGYSFKLFAW